MPHLIHIKASQKQLSKLRNGHKVRIKPSIEGEGFNLIIHPERFDIISRTFLRNKGVDIQLTPQEIALNKELSKGSLNPDEVKVALSPEQQNKNKNQEVDEGPLDGESLSRLFGGGSIFGKKFDRFVTKTIGKKAKKAIYGAAQSLKNPLIEGIKSTGPAIGSALGSAAAIASLNPELAPMAMLAGAKLGEMGANAISSYIENPSKYQPKITRDITTNVGGNRNRLINNQTTLEGEVALNKTFNRVNANLGTNYGNLLNAGLENATNNALSPSQNLTPAQRYYNRMKGQGLYAGGKGINKAPNVSSKYILSPLHPATVSQPQFENFQFRHTLPPEYVIYSQMEGGGLGP